MSFTNKDRLLSQLEELIGYSPHEKIKIKKTKAEPNNIKGTILVIDDEPSMLIYAETFLEIEGYRVLSASSIKEGKKIIQSDLSISLILSDLSMPDENGFDLLEFIRSNIRFSHIPVILVTSYADPEIVMQAKEMGAIDYLVKPYTSDVLIERVGLAYANSSTFILLVVDDELEASLLQRSINQENVKLVRVKNAKQACEELKRRKFNIIISDFILEDATGIDLLGNIIDMGVETPMLFIEYPAFKISNEKVLAVGGYGLIRKPFNNTEIKKIIRFVLKGK